MELRFWGTRGSIATPGPSTTRYGGNTSCVEVATDSGRRFIFDCGTGARPLGAWLMANVPKPVEATILLSHTHWDHIQGFPFFAPLFVPGNRLRICGPKGAQNSLPEVLSGQMEYTYFPVELAELGASIEYRDLSEGTHDFDGIRVSTHFLNHPAVALGYRVEADGVSVLYLCDHEPYWEALWNSSEEPGKLASILHDGDRQHAEFMQNADVVIHDAQYTPEEYPSKKNWGHSTYSYATQMAAAAGVKHLFLTHHDPVHNDFFVDEIESRARSLAVTLQSPLQVCCAREGYHGRFESHHPGQLRDIDSVTPGASLRVLVIDDDEDVRLLVRKALLRGGHSVLEAADGEQGLFALERERPDLLLLDLNMPGIDGFEVLRRVRARDEFRGLPIVVLTAQGDEESIRTGFRLGTTDFLTKPFSSPQLDARSARLFCPFPTGH